MSPELQRRARDKLAATLADQVSQAEAVTLAAILPGVDLNPLAISPAEAAAILGISRWRVILLRHEGRLPVFLELSRDGYTHTRALWRAPIEVLREHRETTPYVAGRGHRWEP
jgi:hypothetical protein